MRQLLLTASRWAQLGDHLLQPSGEEEAAFVLAVGERLLTPAHIILVPSAGFRYKSRFGFELTDEFRAAIIKEAHQRNTMLIEFHSHPFAELAAFSLSDLAGFREFVPHVRWRLKGRPYGAVVVGPDSFEAVLWEENASRLPLTLNVDGTLMFPTRLTEWDD